VHWVHAAAFVVLLGSGLCLYLPSLAEAVGRIHPKTRHSLVGITRGWVDEDWALAHHRKWAEQQPRLGGPEH
jgi:cytochrome b subunit of formate dehydrogenase